MHLKNKSVNNIVLIGMPGCGKSTCGVLLAKALCMSYVDTDLLIQEKESMFLQDIIDKKGDSYFADTEENSICESSFNNTVVATGGSVIYSLKAMEHLKKDSLIIYLQISYETMIERISNIETRGIFLKNNETVEEMYLERRGKYETYADIIINCDGNDIETTVSKLIESLNCQS